MENECRGCRMYNNPMTKCEINIVSHITDTDRCPCMDCLVKGMCDNACKDFRKYSRLSYRDGIKLYKNMRSANITDGHFITMTGV